MSTVLRQYAALIQIVAELCGMLTALNLLHMYVLIQVVAPEQVLHFFAIPVQDRSTQHAVMLFVFICQSVARTNGIKLA